MSNLNFVVRAQNDVQWEEFSTTICWV